MNYKIILLGLCLFILTSFGGKPKPPWEKENVSFPMMNQEIRHTMQENDRQEEMHNKQLTNVAAETANEKQWSKLKETTSKVQDRLRIVSFAMQAIPVGVEMVKDIQFIKDNQQKIYNEISDAPYLIPFIINDQIQFADDAQMTIGLLTGIVLSYGAINQMEKAERKILLEYASAEIQNLKLATTYTLMNIRRIRRRTEMQSANIQYYINRDKQIITDILNQL